MPDWNDFPVCPHCQNVDQDWWDGLPPKNDGDRWNDRCADCGKDYIVDMCVSALFLTTLPPPSVETRTELEE